jgi:ketosteroid isomerase-like protein
MNIPTSPPTTSPDDLVHDLRQPRRRGQDRLAARQNERVVKGFWRAMAANDFAAAGRFLHDDFVLDWPQSGERIRGPENFVAVNQHYPTVGRWQITVDRLIADERGVATDVTVTDGVQADRAITFSELRDGRIIRQTEYWLGGVEPAAWRARWVESGP